MSELAQLTQKELTPQSVRVLEGLGPETIRKIATQSRSLTPSEGDAVKQVFGKSLDPLAMRIGYDMTMSGTNMRGYVLHNNVPVAFFPTDTAGELPESFFHELTHIWQHNNRTQSSAGIPEGVYDISSPAAKGLSFSQLGLDQQAERVKRAANSSPLELLSPKDPQDNDTLTNVRSATGSDPASLGNAAFLESVAQHYNKEPSNDMTARLGSIQGIKAISRVHGRLEDNYTDLRKEQATRVPIPQGTSLEPIQRTVGKARVTALTPPPP